MSRSISHTAYARTAGATLLILLASWALITSAAMPAHAANPRVDVTVEGRGVITVELYEKAAPKTVAHFLKLVGQKFYDGILFHRVVPNFVDQAGDPKSVSIDGSKLRDISPEEAGEKYGLGNGGSGENIPFEKNSYTNERGTLAMALSAPRSATGDSQFFINLKPNTNLNGDYCVFGKVIKGLNVVDKIQQGDRISSMRVVPAGAAPAKRGKAAQKA